MPEPRYRAEDLTRAAETLFQRAGLASEIAAAVAETLVEADLLGFDTHGLRFCPAYVKDIETGGAATSGRPAILNERPGGLTVDGKRLPGAWVLYEAIREAEARLSETATVAVAVRNARNAGCLATYCRREALKGRMMLLTASAPTNAVVAPFGGREGKLATNPFAAGIPATPHPIVFDTSAAAVSNRMTERARDAGQKLKGAYVVGADGRPSDDPAALFGPPKGAILSSGGLDQGYKGFAFGLLTEMLTSGLAGTGRDDADAAGQSLFLLLIEPDAFGGRDRLSASAEALAEQCRASAPMAGFDDVRVPGDRAARRHATQLAEGVALAPDVMPGLLPLLERYDVEAPASTA